MNTTAGRTRRPQISPTQGDTAALDLLTDFGREQLAMLLEGSGALLRGAETMRGIQLSAARQASLRHRAAAQRLRSATMPEDLVTIPFGLAQGDFEAASQCWQQLTAAALDVQMEVAAAACACVFDAQTALETASAIDAIDPGSHGAQPVPARPVRRRARR